MIINTGNRTDIPAYFSEWFYRRIQEGYVLSRSPYDPKTLYRYELNPEVVDLLTFCTKNPKPMLPRLAEISHFRQFWHVTITPYGSEIEPQVPAWEEVVKSFQELSEAVGAQRVCWRYDPIFLSERYTLEMHIASFREMAAQLKGYTYQCVVSFIDLYEKTQRNFPEVRSVSKADQRRLIAAFQEAAIQAEMQIHLCLEDADLAGDHVDANGCYSQEVVEQVIGEHLIVPKQAKAARQGCACLLGADIGAYNTCAHGCRYCYANYDMALVRENRKQHHPMSPLLIGEVQPEDVIRQVSQESWIDPQLRLEDLLSF